MVGDIVMYCVHFSLLSIYILWPIINIA